MKSAQQENIERYLRSEMTEEEKSAFQFELLQNEKLREELAVMRRVQKTLIAEKRSNASGNTGLKLWWFLPLLLLLPLAWFFFDSQDTVDLPSEPLISPPIENPNKDSFEREKIMDDTIDRYFPTEEIKDKKPIASADPADLIPNPLFEEMTTSLRGDNLTLRPKSPSKNAVLTWKKNKQISFVGVIETEATEKPQLNLLIFGNKKADYENWNYLAQTALNIEKTDDGFTYAARPTLSIERGLYYYVMENTETEEPVLTGRFELR